MISRQLSITRLLTGVTALRCLSSFDQKHSLGQSSMAILVKSGLTRSLIPIKAIAGLQDLIGSDVYGFTRPIH